MAQVDYEHDNMSSTNEYPPSVEGVDASQVSHAKSWMEVAVLRPIHSNHAKANPQLPKPSETIVTHSNLVLNSSSSDDEEDAVTNPFTFLMKVPRCEDTILQEQIDLAKLEVDEKSRLADAIQVQIQDKRDNIRIHYDAKDKGQKARSSMKSKRTEINSLMSVISKGNDVLCLEDINRKIENMEHKMQHETLDSKQEKHIISEIKQLKQQHKELLAFLGSQDEIKQALDQRYEAEGRLKVLRKELDILKDSVEATAVEADKKCDAESREMKELQAKRRAANDARQSAYVRWQSLRTKFSVKNKDFFQYKDDAAAAKNCASSGNKKVLHHLCTDQVEKLMQLWNTNDEFRRDYVKSNARSTVQRLGTLDGRSLGPGEKPHVLPAPQKRVDRIMMMTKSLPTVGAKKSNQEEPELAEQAEDIDEAETKEQHRLEELARAEVKERKEAEEKEKARQKRLRKKEKKKASKAKAKAKAEAAMEADDMIDICETAAESSKKDVEISEKPQRQLTRTLSVASLRDQRWILWTGLISFFVYILFMLRNVDVLSMVNLHSG